MDDRPRIEQAARIEEIEALKERVALLEKENAALLQKLNDAKVEQQADKISESQAARDVFAALALDGAGSCGPRDPRVSVWERAFSGIFDALAEIKDEDWRNSCGPGTADPYAKKVALRLKNPVVSERRHRDRANALAQQLTEKGDGMNGVLSEGEATLSVGPEEHIVTVDVPIRLVLCRDAVRYGDREALRSAIREHIEDAVVRALDKFSEAIGVSKSE